MDGSQPSSLSHSRYLNNWNLKIVLYDRFYEVPVEEEKYALKFDIRIPVEDLEAAPRQATWPTRLKMTSLFDHDLFTLLNLQTTLTSNTEPGEPFPQNERYTAFFKRCQHERDVNGT